MLCVSSISSNTAESTSPKEPRGESPPSRPKYSTKRPSQLAGLLGQDGMKSGVDTPDRFFFPHKAHPGGPLSPKAFTSALDRGLTKLSGRDQHQESPRTRPQSDAVKKEDRSNDISEVSSLPSAAEDGESTEQHQDDEERRDLGTPKPVQTTIPDADGQNVSEGRGGDGHVGHRTKAFAFYGQVSRDRSLANTASWLINRPRILLRTNRTRQGTRIRSMRISRPVHRSNITITCTTVSHAGSTRMDFASRSVH
jgi:hypothetical protein